MRKLGGATGRNIILDLMPVILIVANLFAVNADREQTLQLSDLHYHLLEFEHAPMQFILQP